MMKIEWDNSKCRAVLDCHKCLNACPQGVFATYPLDGRGPGKEPGNWVILPAFGSLCTGCGICVDICPQKAITVSAPNPAPA
jgi:ferredoxin